MNIVRMKEHSYIKEHLRCVRHVTLDPEGPGVVRIHMIPPDTTWSRAVPYILVLNGQYLLPVGVSWAIMLSCFIDRIEEKSSGSRYEVDWDAAIKKTVADTRKIYPAMTSANIRKELVKLLDTASSVARGEEPSGDIKVITIGEYAPHMRSPHRMDLMLSAMTKDGTWHCNQKCLHCYAADQAGAEVQELDTNGFKLVIDACRDACIPQLTFTGGEPTMRDDLVELVRYAAWFVTRLNTNGRRLTPELCRALADASLDNVQVTLYSSNREVHNKLVGASGFDESVSGIKNALAAGLGCSVNTPLCKLNRDYAATLEFLHSIGVKYVTCSALIPGGNALSDESVSTRLTSDELYAVLSEAVAYCHSHGMEISFTSPGWLSASRLRDIGLRDLPSCGACLSNMAVRPDGEVIPCQSWLSGATLGNILKLPWKKIWRGERCADIRRVSAANELRCQLAGDEMRGERR